MSKIKMVMSLVLGFCAISGVAQEFTAQNNKYKAELVVEGLEIPWGMEWLPDGSMLITERSGELLRISDGQRSTIDGLPEIHVNGQGGLLDIKAHPDYADNGWLYITFSSPEGAGAGSNTALMRARLD